MYITCNKSTASLNMIVSHDTSNVGELIDLTTESGIFRTAAAIDCQRAISDVMISDECSHSFCKYLHRSLHVF